MGTKLKHSNKEKKMYVVENLEVEIIKWTILLFISGLCESANHISNMDAGL